MPSRIAKNMTLTAEACPLDSDLLCACAGDEFWQSARMWTSGWDFYAPTIPIAYVPEHSSISSCVSSSVQHRHQIRTSPEKQDMRQDTEAAMAAALGVESITKDLPRVGKMGTLRALSVFLEFCGVFPKDGLGTGRARLGLLPNCEENKIDVIAKLGSWERYERVASH